MNSEAGVGPPIPYTPLPRRSIDIHGVLTQVDDDVLLIRVGIRRRVVLLCGQEQSVVSVPRSSSPCTAH